MSSKKFLILCILVISVVGTFFLIKKTTTNNPSDSDSSSLDLSKYNINSVIDPTEDNGNIGDHIKGDKNATVTIFEYADYQCSGCANMNSVMKQLLEEYSGKLKIVYRNFPLVSLHPNAIAAASAVEAAGLQGYWEKYGDLLFANQAEWFYDTGNTRTERFMSYFTSLAGDAGDLPRFRQDMASKEVKKKVEFDKAIAESLNIEATPSFFGSDGTEIPWIEENLETKEDVLNYFRNYIDTQLATKQ